jgi:hypothetical protein
MNLDYAGAEGGRLALAFASGCTGAWVFMRNLVMKPAIKSCHQRCTDLEKAVDWLKEQLTAKDVRIGQLETALFTSGIPELRKAMQGVISEARMETEAKIGAVEKKMGGIP